MDNVVFDSNYNCSVFCQDLLNSWEYMPYAELSVIAVWLKALAQVHQSHHWQASSDPFYGDHLLFQRLYEESDKSIDRVMEKAVGLGSSDLACPYKLALQTHEVIKSVYFVRPGIPQSTDLVVRSMHLEKNFLQALENLKTSLTSKSLLTAGVDNMLADISDLHEGHIYLLKQRML